LASIWQDVFDLEVAVIHSFHRGIEYSSLVSDFMYSDWSLLLFAPVTSVHSV